MDVKTVSNAFPLPSIKIHSSSALTADSPTFHMCSPWEHSLNNLIQASGYGGLSSPQFSLLPFHTSRESLQSCSAASPMDSHGLLRLLVPFMVAAASMGLDTRWYDAHATFYGDMQGGETMREFTSLTVSRIYIYFIFIR